MMTSAREWKPMRRKQVESLLAVSPKWTLLRGSAYSNKADRTTGDRAPASAAPEVKLTWVSNRNGECEKQWLVINPGGRRVTAPAQALTTQSAPPASGLKPARSVTFVTGNNFVTGVRPEAECGDLRGGFRR